MNNLLKKSFHPIVRNLNTCASVAVLKIIISNQVHTRPNSNCVIYENAVGTCLFACKNLDAILSIEFYHLDSIQTGIKVHLKLSLNQCEQV